MADTQPQVKVNRVKLYKMISYKGTKNSASQKKYTPLTAAKAIGDMEQDVTSGMKGLLGGLNSLGATLNTIGLAVEGIAEQMKTTVATQIRAQSKILSSAKDGLKAEKKRNNDEAKKKKKEKDKEERDKAEDESEKGKSPLFGRIKKEFAEGTKKAFGGLFGGLARMALSLFTFFVGYKILDWMSKNPDKVEAIAKTLAAVGKFIFNVTGFLVGSALDGLISFLENPVSIQGLFGMVQFIASAAPLFLGFAFLKNPLKTARALAWVIGSLGKGIMNLFKAQKFAKGIRKFSSSKFGKVALSVGAGAIAATAVSATGGSTAEAISAGVGAGAGQAIGGALGAATGIPGAGAVAGAAGAFVGGGIGKAVGPMLEPIMKPIGDFFKMVGDVFNAIFDPIKDALGAAANNGTDSDNDTLGVMEYAAARFSLLKAIQLTVVIPGNVGLAAGQLIQVSIPSSTEKGNKNPKVKQDKKFSGKYLIAGLTHIYKPSGVSTKLYLTRDSIKNPDY